MVNISPYIGSISGIKIQLHWSFVLLLVFSLVLSLYLFAVIVLLFICVLLHELAHSITSKRNGIGVKKIILLPIGGASVIDMEEIDPDIEFRISIAGPIASIFIGVALGVAVVLIPGGAVRHLVQLLFLINILLGVFNLLPGFPLDGGRVFRSYEQKKHSFFDATKITVKLSKIVIVLFIVGTVIYAAVEPGYTFAYREFVVFWDILIAIFLYGGAQAEYQTAYVREMAADLRVRDAVSKDFASVKPGTTIGELYNIFMKYHTHVIIVDYGKSVKLVQGVKMGTSLNPGYMSNTVDSFCTEIPTIGINKPLPAAIDKMRNENTGIIAVKVGRKVVGVLVAQHVESVIALHISKKNASVTNKNLTNR
ncbi:MAG: site-2 protease family protein [Candidatus Marsarchaeota archaeon]|jgi:Zn-dependent protease|nr:site-2 protease family protein [Candidatus Marsarchaeota archaeon]